MINFGDGVEPADSAERAEARCPECRCTREERAAGHRHRCPAGPLTYVAVGPWEGLTSEEIEEKSERE